MGIPLCPNLLSEHLIPLKRAGKHVPGGGVSPACLERWVRTGMRGVRLEICRIGRTRHTSEEAIQRFLEALNRTDTTVSPIRRLSEREIAERKRSLGMK